MSLHTLGTAATTSLVALPAWAQTLAIADVAALAQAITDDGEFAAVPGGVSAGPTAVIGTATTHSNTTLDTIAQVSGALLTSIAVGDLVLGVNIVPGTYVIAKASSTSVTLSQAAGDSAAGKNVAFVRPGATQKPAIQDGRLYVPNRGYLNLLPGDIVAIDNAGWPILVSAASIAYAGSLWSFT